MHNRFRSFLLICGPVLVACIVVFFIFHHLAQPQIRLWDEARNANDAIDMYTGKNLLVVKHLGQTDLYNIKPPFALWMQALSMSVFGINELGLRFPTALFAVLTALLLFWFCFRVLKSSFAGCFAALALVSTRGFMIDHVARTGDPDGILVFWLSFYALVFLALLLNKPEKSRPYFVWAGIGICAAVLTKGVAGLFFAPFLFLVSLLPENRFIYRQRSLYVTAGISLAVCLAYYFLREALEPGYLKLVYVSEWSRISSEVMSWQVHPFTYYYENLRDYRFTTFFYALPFLLLTPLLTKKNKTAQKAFFYLAFLSLAFFFLISYPPVKLPWYDAPLFPLLALLLGIFADALLQQVLLWLKQKPGSMAAFALYALVPLFVFYSPLKAIYETQKFPEDGLADTEADGAFLRFVHHKHPELKELVLLQAEDKEEYRDQVLFYIRAFEKEDQLHTKLLDQSRNLQPGTLVLTTQQPFKDSIAAHYRSTVLDQWNTGTFYRIDSQVPDTLK